LFEKNTRGVGSTKVGEAELNRRASEGGGMKPYRSGV